MPNKSELNTQLAKQIIRLTFASSKDGIISAIETLLQQGANPLALVDQGNGSYSEPILMALKLGSLHAVDAILKHSRLSGFPILLSFRSSESNQFARKFNLFQNAALTSNVNILDLFYKHGIETRQNMYQIANEHIEFQNDQELFSCQLIEVIISSINTYSIFASKMLDDSIYGDEEKLCKALDFLKKWELHYGTTPPPTFNEPIRLIWAGRLDSVTYLLNNKLVDLDALTASTLKVSRFIELFSQTDNFDSWLLKLCFFMCLYSGFKIKREDITVLPNNQILFKRKLLNKTGNLEHEFEILFDLNAVNQLVQTTVADLRQAKLHRKASFDNMKQKLLEHEERHATTEKTLSTVPAVRLNAIREYFKHDPALLACFNHVYDQAYSHILARKLAATKLFTVKSTDITIKAAKIAQSVFEVIASTSGVSAVAAGGTRLALTILEEYRVNAQNKAVSKATTGVNFDSIAIDVAALITDVLQENNKAKNDPKTPNKLAAHVVHKINQMAHFNSSVDLVGFLCVDAVNSLQLKKAHVKHGSGSDSTPTDSDELNTRVVAIEDKKLEQRKHKKDKGNKRSWCLPFF